MCLQGSRREWREEYAGSACELCERAHRDARGDGHGCVPELAFPIF